MPRDDRSYAQAMSAYDAEKKFLRKSRHFAFHPDYDRPLLFRLTGYVVRLVILAAVLAAILFIRNRSYFNSLGFSENVNERLDHFLHADDSRMEKIYWKGDQAVTNYRVKGGPSAFYTEMHLPRVAARGTKRQLLVGNDWQLRDVEIGQATVYLKGGPTPDAEDQRPRPAFEGGNWWTATPDFSRTRFGDIKLQDSAFHWGPHWTSEGSFTECTGTLSRQLSEWSLNLTSGTLNQNWLKNLRVREESPFKITVAGDKITLTGKDLVLGEMGKVSINGIITLSETPEFDVMFNMQMVEVQDLLPLSFQNTLSGLANIRLKMFGSTNQSSGIQFEGEVEMIEKGRLRNLPILSTLVVVTKRPEMRHMPIRANSTFKFKTREGRLEVTDIRFKGGGGEQSGLGYKNSSGAVQDFARLVGSFSYQMDTSALDQNLVLADLKRSDLDAPLSDQEESELEFKGEARLAMPWELLGDEASIRDHFFERDTQDYGWITIPIDGGFDTISKTEATQIDQAWADLKTRRKNPFEES